MTEPAATAAPDHDGPSVTDSAPAPPAKGRTDSRLGRLREMRRSVRNKRESLKLEIPGYGNELIAAYRVLSFEELKKIRSKGREMTAANDNEAELKVACDTIATACVGFFVPEEDGTLSPLNEEEDRFGDEPIRYDSRLAEVLEIDTKRVRILIREMFPTDLSILAHTERLMGWMESERAEDDADFQKPSQATSS